MEIKSSRALFSLLSFLLAAAPCAYGDGGALPGLPPIRQAQYARNGDIPQQEWEILVHAALHHYWDGAPVSAKEQQVIDVLKYLNTLKKSDKPEDQQKYRSFLDNMAPFQRGVILPVVENSDVELKLTPEGKKKLLELDRANSMQGNLAPGQSLLGYRKGLNKTIECVKGLSDRVRYSKDFVCQAPVAPVVPQRAPTPAPKKESDIVGDGGGKLQLNKALKFNEGDTGQAKDQSAAKAKKEKPGFFKVLGDTLGKFASGLFRTIGRVAEALVKGIGGVFKALFS